MGLGNDKNVELGSRVRPLVFRYLPIVSYVEDRLLVLFPEIVQTEVALAFGVYPLHCLALVFRPRVLKGTGIILLA
jgi:hypothetical protein